MRISTFESEVYRLLFSLLIISTDEVDSGAASRKRVFWPDWRHQSLCKTPAQNCFVGVSNITCKNGATIDPLHS